MKQPIVFLLAGSFVIGVICGTYIVAPLVQPPNAPPAVAPVPAKPVDPFSSAVAAGNQAMDEKRYAQAVEAYDQALAMRFDADVATDRGVSLRLLGDRQRALTTFEFILLKDPGHWQARYNRAVVLLDLGRIDEARADVETLLTQQPADPAIRQLRQAVESAGRR